MHVYILLTRERYVSAPLPLLIKHRTRDLLLVLLTILIEHYYAFKNINTPTSRPSEYNDIQFFKIDI